MSASLGSSVCFATFQLDLRTGELRRAGVRINLSDQPLQVLKTLLDCPGELVTREELRQRLWSADTFVDFEHGLNAAVRRLRDALGDSAEAPRFIETLPRRGYRFIAPVTRPSAADSPAPSHREIDSQLPAFPTEDVKPGRPRTRVWVWRVSAAMALVAAAALWTSGYRPWSRATRQSTSESGRFMLAVLPFENLTGDPDQEYISDGMTDELIVQLGRMDPSRLGVIARTSAMQFKKSVKRANQIGADLAVGYLIEGSVRTTRSRIRIAVQLIETRHESQLWAEQYERDAKDLLTLQRDVGEAIARQITASLAIASLPASAERHSPTAEAYEHYLRGRYHWQQDTTDGLSKAKEHFRRAIELDPSYALAYTGLADTYTLLGSYGVLPMREAYPLGKVAALKALELDDTLGEAHNSLAAISADFYWEWTEAERHFKRAVELNPNYETALGFYSSYLAYMGRHEEALTFATRARDLDPASPSALHNLGMAHYFARRYDDAITQFRETLDLDPAFGGTHVMLGRVYIAKGLPDRAVEELERARALLGPRPDVVTSTAYVLARAGRKHEALATIDELRRISKPRDPAPFRIAYVHIGLGDTERAFEWLLKAIEAHDWQMAMLKVEPAFDDLRSDPRFPALVERVGLPR